MGSGKGARFAPKLYLVKKRTRSTKDEVTGQRKMNGSGQRGEKMYKSRRVEGGWKVGPR